MTDDQKENAAGRRLRQLLAEQEYVFAPGLFNPLQAALAEEAGHDAVYMSGYSTVLGQWGLPDLEIATREQMVDNARWIARKTDLPVVADCDTGYGGIHSLRMAIRDYEDAGVAAVHIEDQESPKRCGHIAGKRVVSREKARGRFDAAIDARRSEDTVIIARTDAYGAANGGWEEHVERGRLYADAGVDLVWPEMPDPDREDAIRYAEAIHETHPDQRLAFNYSSSFHWSEQDDPLTFDELADAGYSYIFITLYALHSSAYHVYEDLRRAAEAGERAQFDLEERYLGHPTESHHDLADVGRYQAIEREYEPGAAADIDRSEGYSDD